MNFPILYNRAWAQAWFEAIFQTGRTKKRSTNNIVGQSRLTKQKLFFQIGRQKTNNVSDLGNNKCKCARPIDPKMKTLTEIINQTRDLKFVSNPFSLFLPFCFLDCSNFQLLGYVKLNVYI